MLWTFSPLLGAGTADERLYTCKAGVGKGSLHSCEVAKQEFHVLPSLVLDMMRMTTLLSSFLLQCCM